MSVPFLIAIATGALALGLAVLCGRLWTLLTAARRRVAPIVNAEAEAAQLRRAALTEADAMRRAAEDAAVSLAQRAEVAATVRMRAAEAAAAEALRAADQARSDAEARVATAREELDQLRRQHTEELERMTAARDALSAEYAAARTTYERLRHEVALLEENLEDISFGVYRPHFTYQTSEEYKRVLEGLWERDRAMVRRGEAAVCRARWEVGGSVRAGAQMTRQYVKLLVRAFNAECDAAVAKVTWNNRGVMEERIRKAFTALNQLGTVMQMEICQTYLELKLQELKFTHEQEEKRQQEKEEARRHREQMREEERVQRELAAAAESADKVERSAARALDRARRDTERAASEAERAALASRIQELEAELAAARAQKERAVAQAQLTKSGHVYVLSNLGAFGEGVVKIGMTRRLEPLERVAELGDASVPFPFDLHALIYTENAPQLEADLHTHFWGKRINLANDRKEFFRVPLDEIETFLQARGLTARVVHLAEAKEYRLTCAAREEQRRAQAAASESAAVAAAFPQELFAAAPH